MELIADSPPALGLPRQPARLEEPGLSVLGGEHELLHELAAGIGGPYHLLFPERFDAAAGAFAAVLGEAGVGGRVYFAKKANKAACWMRRCAELGLGVDVASPGELRGALAEGVRGEALVVTGPAAACSPTSPCCCTSWRRASAGHTTWSSRSASTPRRRSS